MTAAGEWWRSLFSRRVTVRSQRRECGPENLRRDLIRDAKLPVPAWGQPSRHWSTARVSLSLHPSPPIPGTTPLNEADDFISAVFHRLVGHVNDGELAPA